MEYWALSKYEVKVNVEGKSLADEIDCNRGILQLQITSVKVLVSQRIDSIACRIKRKRFFKRKINYYSSHDATYQLELLILSCGDVHPNPGHVHQPSVPSNNNNNPPLENRQSRATKLSVFYANARSIVNKTAKLQMEMASNSFDIIVLTETHLDSSINDENIVCIEETDSKEVVLAEEF